MGLYGTAETAKKRIAEIGNYAIIMQKRKYSSTKNPPPPMSNILVLLYKFHSVEKQFCGATFIIYHLKLNNFESLLQNNKDIYVAMIEIFKVKNELAPPIMDSMFESRDGLETLSY